MQFYMKECVKEGWKVRELRRQINSSLFQRLALSTDKEGVLALANEGHQVQTAADIIRDPFVLEFAGLPRQRRYKEKDLEDALKAHMEQFLLELGRGYKKIREGFEPAGIPMPKVENFCGGVQVTIERTQFMKMLNGRNVTSDVTSNVTSNVGSMSVVQLTERQQKICELIKKDSFISAQQMSVVLSVVKRTIERDLADMQKKGVLIREGNTSAGHWIVLLKKPEG